ncbi:MAG: hypothetical protein IPK66_18930 [Rhodospirillales bacterium]|nr:hypothetical protein [Rhodospirillales bacterium]
MTHRPLSDALTWGLMIDPGTIVTKAGELMTCLRYVPRDRASSSPTQNVASRSALNSALRRFGSRWALWFEDVCDETLAYESPLSFPDPVSAAIDEQRRRLFTTPGVQLASTYVVTLLYAPLPDAIGRLAASFEQAGPAAAIDDKRYRSEVERFRAGVEAFRLHLSDVMPVCEPLTGARLITYLHSRVSTDHRPLAMPDLPIFLAEFLTDDAFVPGVYPKLGGHHLRTVRVKDQPSSFTPGMLLALGGVGFPYNHVARWLPLSREDAEQELEARRDSWAAARKGFLIKVFANVFRFHDDGTKDNLAAIANMEGSAAALALLAQGDCTFGRWTHTVTVTHPDAETVKERCRIIQQIFAGFVTSVAEDDAMSTWIGSLPGHPRGGLDRFLGPSISFAEIVPSSATWCGPARDEHLDGPPLLQCMSDGGKAFRLCLHQDGSDLGHAVVLGESGGGKSTLLKSMVAAHRKYPGSRVFYIDRGSVAKLVTLALGGEFHALAAGDDAVSLQPLAFIDQPGELSWAFEFVLGCLQQQGLETSAAQKRELTIALRALASQPAEMRTLTSLRHATQDDDIKDALAVFCVGGACGDLLDNAEYRVGGTADVRCFETDRLLQNPTALAPVLACVFHEIARSYEDARPTLVVIDECKTFISHSLIADQVDELIRRARRENMQVVLATHSMIDIEHSSIGHIIDSSIKTKLFTATAGAIEPRTAAALERSGLTPTQIGIIAGLRPKREYAIKVGEHWRVFELALSDYERAIVCGGSGAESKLIDKILAAGPREEFAERWLRHRGIAGPRIWQEAAE